MEESEKLLIQDNFFSLITNTTCSFEFLLKFKSQCIFTVNDIKAIMSFCAQMTPADQAYQFYSRILEKEANPEVYNILLTALKETNQFKPYWTLMGLMGKPKLNGTTEHYASSSLVLNQSPNLLNHAYLHLLKEGRNFKHAPESMIKFLSTECCNILLLRSESTQVTISKIGDTMRNVEIVNHVPYTSKDGNLLVVLIDEGEFAKEVLNTLSLQQRQQKLVLLHSPNVNVEGITALSGNDFTKWEHLTTSYKTELIQKLEKIYAEKLKRKSITEILEDNHLDGIISAKENDTLVLGQLTEEFLRRKMAKAEIRVGDDLMEDLGRIALPTVFPWLGHVENINASRNDNGLQLLVSINLLKFNGNYEFVNIYAAHYYLAKYLLKNGGELGSLTEVVFETEAVFSEVCFRFLGSFKFLNKMFISFINYVARNCQWDQSEASLWSLKRLDLKEVAVACISGNFYNVLDLLKTKIPSLNGETLLLAIKFGDEETALTLFQRCRNLREISKTIRYQNVTLLHAAVEKGRLQLTRTLLFEYGFIGELGKICMRNLVHFCVSYTANLSEEKVTERCKIVTLLHNADKHLIHENVCMDAQWVCMSTPLTCWGVHMGLIKHLVALGADVSSRDGRGKTVAYSVAEYGSPRQFHEVVQLIIETGKGNLLLERGPILDNRTPLEMAITKFEVEEDTLTLFQDVGLQMNEEDRSLLHTAVMAGRTPAFIRALVQRGANVNWEDQDGQTALHKSVLFPNEMQEQVVQTLLELGADAGFWDKEHHSPLWLALNGEASHKVKVETIQLLKQQGAID